jgi:DNA recombination protein RmuC
VEKQSADIMRLLGAIKKSFERFSQALESTKKSMDAASNNLEKASTSSRGILQRLRTVEESADLYEAQALLGDAYPGEENVGPEELE